MLAFDPFVTPYHAHRSRDPKLRHGGLQRTPAVPEAVKLAVGLLEEEFMLRETASDAFPHWHTVLTSI